MLIENNEPIPADLQPVHINGLALKTVELVLAADTQWSYFDTGIRKGLNYPSVFALAKVFKYKINKTTLQLIQIAEDALIGISIDSYEKAKKEAERKAKQAK
jgi:hypothetical protein